MALYLKKSDMLQNFKQHKFLRRNLWHVKIKNK